MPPAPATAGGFGLADGRQEDADALEVLLERGDVVGVLDALDGLADLLSPCMRTLASLSLLCGHAR
jgi:hypothetical protein